MPPVSSVLGNCVVCKEAGIKASPSAACARGTGRDGRISKVPFIYICSNHLFAVFKEFFLAFYIF